MAPARLNDHQPDSPGLPIGGKGLLTSGDIVSDEAKYSAVVVARSSPQVTLTGLRAGAQLLKRDE